MPFVFFFLGVVAVIFGTAWIYLPAGLILGGLFLILAAIGMEGSE